MKCCICHDHEGTVYLLHENYEHYAHVDCLSELRKKSSEIDDKCPLCTLPVELVSLPGMLRQAVETKTIEEFKEALNASKHSVKSRVAALICAFNAGKHTIVHILLHSGGISNDHLLEHFRCPMHNSPFTCRVFFGRIAANAASPLDFMLMAYMLKKDRKGTMLLLEEGARDSSAFCLAMACMLGWEDCVVQLISKSTYSGNELFRAAKVAISEDNVQIVKILYNLGIFDEPLLTFCKIPSMCYDFLSRTEVIDFQSDFLDKLRFTLKSQGFN